MPCVVAPSRPPPASFCLGSCRPGTHTGRNQQSQRQGCMRAVPSGALAAQAEKERQDEHPLPSAYLLHAAWPSWTHVLLSFDLLVPCLQLNTLPCHPPKLLGSLPCLQLNTLPCHPLKLLGSLPPLPWHTSASLDVAGHLAAMLSAVALQQQRSRKSRCCCLWNWQPQRQGYTTSGLLRQNAVALSPSAPVMLPWSARHLPPGSPVSLRHVASPSFRASR